jgi:predicted  nucleic acid-binding Zn-ribbon protein
MKESVKSSASIDERLLNAYKRIRQNSRNGLAVVAVERDACGGCYNKIPPQRQLDIRLNKKIIVCEHCGRVLVDGMLIPDLIEKA